MVKRTKHKAAAKKPAAPAHRAQQGHATLSRRPVWQGHLRLSLVSCPIALYGATSRSGDVSFHMINPKTNNRIRMIATDPDTGPVERSDLVKGYEIEKNKYVIVTNEEIDSVRLETTKTIDIERFVDADDIDRLYWNDPYFLVPDGKTGAEAYTVIRDALEETGRIAIGRVVMHTRERVVALEPRGKGIVAYTLRAEDEVIDPKTAFDDIPATRSDKKMVDIARKIIEQQEGAFEPAMFEDRYEKALKDLIKRKQKGEKPIKSEPVDDTNVIDLMEALKKSLKHKGGTAHREPANSNAKPKKRAHK
ncbi:MAG TPA: Ku protein [Rhizomicrobium sp.]|jgi:DNA end-binding protein Ku|nr:Ku protein [Rhizomicrobium sp.]